MQPSTLSSILLIDLFDAEADTRSRNKHASKINHHDAPSLGAFSNNYHGSESSTNSRRRSRS